MKITIITVAYNSEYTIEQTITSILNQTYKNIEYIIIDGGSSDKTINIIRKYEDKITYWISEKDNGIYNAMNKGLLVATGDYIQFLNADDALCNNHIIEDVVNTLKKYRYPDVFSGNIILVDEQFALEKLLKTLKSVEEIKNGGVIPHPGTFIKRDILKKFKFNENYKIVSDFELILRLALANKTFIFSNIAIAFFSTGGISSNNEKLRRDEHYKVLEKYIGKEKAENFLKQEYCFINKLKKYIKIKLKDSNLLLRFKFILGWKKHQCNNKYRRWCKKNNKGKC